VRVHQITGTAEVLEEAIRTYEEALQLCPTGHDRRDACVINLGDGLLRFCDSEDADSPRLERCIALLREALELRPPGHSARDEALDVLGCALWLRFRHRGDMDMLKEVIGIGREILQLRPPEHVGYTDSLLFLAKSLRKSFELSGDSTQLDEAIQLQREVLLSCPPGHELRIFYLRGLAASLTFRFHVQGGLDTLDEAIDLHRAALSLCPPGDGSRAEGLDKLAYCLHQRFRQRDDLGTLQEAIELHREALHLRPVGDPSRQMTLTNLGFALRDLSDLQGNFDILHEAIQLQREALRLCPVGHPKRGFFLNNLARCLHHWLERTISGQEVFDEVVYLYREALSLHPPGHRDRSEALSGLASILRIRFLRQGGLETWTEAVDLGREALQLTPPGSPYRRIYLNNLAATLSTLTPEQYSVRAIDEAIQLQREALRLCPPGHLLHNELGAENLAQNLETRSRREGDLEALEEALNLVRGVLELRPPGHPRRSSALSLLGRCLLAEHTKVFDFTQAMTYFLQALTDDATAFDVRLDIAKQFLIAVEHAYPTAMSDLDVATQAERNLSILKLYNEAVHLLPRAANFGLDRQTRLTTVARSESVSCYAAARALLLGRANEAVEMLEEGRGVFWSQTLYLRAYGLEDVPVDDRQELQQIFHTLQNDNEIQKASSEDRDRVLEERRQLSLRADAVIARIRGYPGLERFLLPPAFSALMGSMPDGFVVILNASQLVHHALLIDRKAGLAKSFALKSPGDDFVYAKLHTRLPRDLGASLSTEDAEDEVDSRGIGIASKRSAKQGFEGALAKLWVIIVQPILEKLGLQVRSAAISHHAKH
jgi:tetratricopeptide (TPR) repeat protein